MRKVILTGISGLLGINLANELLSCGYSVKGLIRDNSVYKGSPHQNLELIRGNLFDNLEAYCNDCDYIIHSAAETRQNLIHYSDYKMVNCDATIRLFEAGVKCGVKRFIFISTANTIGHGSTQHPGTELNEACSPFTSLFYAKSKLEAENYLLKQNCGMEVVIINPGFMIGPFDTKPSSGKIILMGLGKRIILYPPGGKSFVHVKDVARGIIRSIDKAKPGNKYLIINENVTYAGFFKKLNSCTGQQPFMVKIPKSLLMVLGYLGELARLAGIRTDFSVVNMQALCVEGYYSHEKSVTELGIEYCSLDSAISEAVDYFKKVKQD